MSRKFLALSFAAIALTACAGGDATAPTVRAPRDVSADASFGKSGSGKPTAEAPKSLVCSIPVQLSGSATIGKEGGILLVGANALIVPPGALKTPTKISGIVPAGHSLVIHLYPEGLEFKKDATLILDLNGCTAPPPTLYVDYLNDSGEVVQRIQTLFATWFHFIAAPIEHFSIYALDV